MSQIMNFEAITNARMHIDPFPWGYYEGVFSEPDRLMAEFPTDEYSPHSQQTLLESLGHKGSDSWYQHNVRTRPLLELGETTPYAKAGLSDTWLGVAEDLASKEYRERLTELTGHDVRELPMQAHFWRFLEGAYFQPHVDKPHKIVTHLMYLTGDWSADMGGCFRVLESEDPGDVHTEIPPTPNNSLVLRRTDNAWHCVSGVRRGTDRARTLLQAWFWK